MSLRTPQLQRRFLAPFDGAVLGHSDLKTKPLEVDLARPNPPLLRVYLFNLIGGVGTLRDWEYKVSLRAPGQEVGEYASFSYADGRVAMLIGYRDDLDVFVLWDASLHPQFKHGGNVAVHTNTVLAAASAGVATQPRRCRLMNTTELVLACQSSTLVETVVQRVMLTGGVADAEAPC